MKEGGVGKMLAVSKINIVSLNICRYEVSSYIMCSNRKGQPLRKIQIMKKKKTVYVHFYVLTL